MVLSIACVKTICSCNPAQLKASASSAAFKDVVQLFPKDIQEKMIGWDVVLPESKIAPYKIKAEKAQRNC